MKAVIIDDEEKCIANLSYHLSKYCPLIEIVGTATTLDSAQQLLKNQKPQIAFLDIEIGNDNSFNLLKGNLDFEVVFVTAYEKYAIKAFKAEAIDYLLKPLSKVDILQCYRKITKQLLHKLSNDIALEQENGISIPLKMILKQGGHVFVVKLIDIHYLKAKGFYTEVFFEHNGAIISSIISKPISSIEKQFDPNVFFRLHKSYIINTQKVQHVFRGTMLSVEMQSGHLIPVAKRRVAEFMEFLNNQR